MDSVFYLLDIIEDLYYVEFKFVALLLDLLNGFELVTFVLAEDGA